MISEKELALLSYPEAPKLVTEIPGKKTMECYNARGKGVGGDQPITGVILSAGLYFSSTI